MNKLVDNQIDNKIISFIIPAYNSERFIENSLQSFLLPKNDKNHKKLEVIIINDGSTDRTPFVAQSYVNNYPYLFKLYSKENGGHGSAINLGAKLATGKFFKVIDADDWINTSILSKFIDFLCTCSSDVILTPFHMVDMNTRSKYIQRMYIHNYNFIYSLNEICEHWRQFNRCTVFHGITYRTDFYMCHYHELPQKIYYEDLEFASIPFCHAKTIAVQNYFLYQYLIGNSDQSVSNENKIARLSHLEQVIDNILDYKNNISKDLDSNKYLNLQIEAALLSYYTVTLIINPKRKEGRHQAVRMYNKIRKHDKKLHQQIKCKYYLFFLFSLLHIDLKKYETIIHSKPFRLIIKNHPIEQEP